MNAERAIQCFEGFSSPVRLDIFRALVRHEPHGLVAGEISEKLGIPPTNLSFHLRILCTAQLITCTQEGRFLRYRAVTSIGRDLANFLTAECCADTCCNPTAKKRPQP